MYKYVYWSEKLSVACLVDGRLVPAQWEPGWGETNGATRITTNTKGGTAIEKLLYLVRPNTMELIMSSYSANRSKVECLDG